MNQRIEKRNARSWVGSLLAWTVALGIPLLLLTVDRPLIAPAGWQAACAYGDKEPAAPDGETALRLLQYNVQFLLPDIALNFVSTEEIGHWPSTTERARAVGQVLAEGCFDIMVLNETVNKTRREEILAILQQSTAHCTRLSGVDVGEQLYVASGPALDHALALRRVDDLIALMRRGQEATLDDAVVGDELTIISRLPIVETHALTFTEGAGIDVGAAKGVLHARLWRGAGYGAGHMIDVFATHLQAGDHDAIRRSQLAQLAAFIQARRHPAIPFLVLGDFNIDGSQQARADARSAYRESLRPWAEALGLQDAGRQLAAGTEGDGEERIDYIFVSGDELDSGNGLDVVQAAVKPYVCAGMDLSFCGDAYPTLSDHAAMTVDLLWRHGAEVERSICDDEGDGR